MRYSRLASSELNETNWRGEAQPLMGDSSASGSTSRDDVYLLPLAGSPSSSRIHLNDFNMFRSAAA
ncbi:hypothetical protein Tcan_17506 [Toxocara canis]|uniref:Uncharacterized protein n=1 Tax=Toxocara canis TaxID=6265 RepID=A0A0B2VCC0_TOXCA|nr:hypothetical protein Tcan_17506 [Toxocara canis]